MKRLFFIIMIILMGMGAMYGQSYSTIKLEGNRFVEKRITNEDRDYKKTEFTYKDYIGDEYPIFIKGDGRCYIYRIKADGHLAKEWLPDEVCEIVCKKLGRRYTFPEDLRKYHKSVLSNIYRYE